MGPRDKPEDDSGGWAAPQTPVLRARRLAAPSLRAAAGCVSAPRLPAAAQSLRAFRPARGTRVGTRKQGVPRLPAGSRNASRKAQSKKLARDQKSGGIAAAARIVAPECAARLMPPWRWRPEPTRSSSGSARRSGRGRPASSGGDLPGSPCSRCWRTSGARGSTRRGRRCRS